MKRRDILKAALGFTSVAVTNASGAQTRGPKRVGYLSGASQGLREITIDILEERLRALSACRHQRNSRRIHSGARSALLGRHHEYRATGRKHDGSRPRTSNSMGQAARAVD